MATMVFSRSIEMTSNTENGWRYSRPSSEDIGQFCKETTEWANQNGWRIVAITPITGGLDLVSQAGGTAMTCGFVVVAERA
jgi:hypothetical protein